MGEGEAVPGVQAGAEVERRCAEEAVAAAEAALGAGEDEAEGEEGVEGAPGTVGMPAHPVRQGNGVIGQWLEKIALGFAQGSCWQGYGPEASGIQDTAQVLHRNRPHGLIIQLPSSKPRLDAGFAGCPPGIRTPIC